MPRTHKVRSRGISRTAAVAAAAILLAIAWLLPSAAATPAASADTPTPVNNSPLCDPSPDVVLCVLPTTQSINFGASASVAIDIQNVADLGAFEFTVAFDPNLLSFTSITAGPFLGGSGRSVNCLSPALGVGTVRFVCVTLGTDPEGAAGSGTLATLVLHGDAHGSSTLVLENVTLLEPNAAPIVVAGSLDGAIAIGSPPTATPTATPCVTCTATPTLTPTATPTPCLVLAVPCTPTSTRTSTPTRTPSPTATASPAATSTPGLVALHVAPTTQQVAVESTTFVDVVADGVVNLGAFDITLTYDPSVVTFLGAESGALLGSSGRSVSCIAPSTTTISVTLTCVTLGTAPDGASGSGVLARFEFLALFQGASALTITESTLLHVNATPQSIGSLSGGAIQVIGIGTSTPTNTATATVTPCQVVGTPCTQTPTATPSPTATPCVVLAVPCTPTNTATRTPTRTPTPTGTASPTMSATPGDVTVRISPTTMNVPLGLQFTVDIVADGLVNLGAFDVTLSYDPGLSAFVSATSGPMIGSTGRTVSCLPVDQTITTTTLTCLTLGTSPEGATGSGVIARFTFAASSLGVGSLNLIHAAVLHPDSSPQLVGSILGAAVSVGPPASPTNTPTATFTPTPCVVLAVPCTPTNTATPTLTPTQSPTPVPGSPTSSPTAGSGSTMTINPAGQSVAVGADIVLTVDITSASNIGAYEFALTYDEALLDFVSVTNGAFLGSTGRTVFCPGAVLGSGSVRLGCASSGPQVGASGAGTVATVTLHAAVAGTSALSLSLVSTSNPIGDSQPAFAGPPSSVTITPFVSSGGSSSGGGRFARAGSALPSPGALIAGASLGLMAVLFTKRRRWGVPAGAIAAFGLAALAAPLLGSNLTSADGAATVQMTPAQVEMRIGGADAFVTQDVVLPDGVGLSEFTIAFTYDASALDVTLQEGAFLGSTGRATSCAEHRLVGLIAYACASQGPQSPPTGSGQLAIVQLHQRAGVKIKPTDGNGRVVKLDDLAANITLFDASAQPIAVQGVTDSIVLLIPLAGDFTGDCKINVKDEQSISYRYGADPEGDLYDPYYDVAPVIGDDDIGISDLQFVYGRDGAVCPAAVPTPPGGCAQPDADCDGVTNNSDNCSTIANADQLNSDGETTPNGPNLVGDDGTWPMSDHDGDACDTDDDNDGISDTDEATGAACLGIVTDPLLRDTDGDHLTDGWECAHASNPTNAASKSLGAGTADADGDHVPDLWEERGYAASGSSADSDGDGCADMVEVASVDGNKALSDTDRLAVARRTLNIWAPNVAQDYVFDLDKNGSLGDSDRLFVARAVLLPSWLPKSCP